MCQEPVRCKKFTIQGKGQKTIPSPARSIAKRRIRNQRERLLFADAA
jgi:hypothetical protein